jgi:hypothetical protein
MKLSPTKSGKSDFLSVYKDAMDNTIMMSKGDPERLYNLRCSQLPYCPAAVLLNWGQRGMVQPMDLMMAFYVHVGHAVHRVMQDYLSQSGNFLADYECKECGKKYPLSHKIECCGFPTSYEEVTLKVGSKKKGYIGGHIDGIFKDKYGNYWILDFKTSSIAGAPAKVKNAPEGYRRQVRAYAYLLRKQYGIKVVGLMLVYIPRDNPKQPEIWEYKLKPEDWSELKTELYNDKKLHRKTMVAETIDDMKTLLKHGCGGQYCSACKMPNGQKVKLLTKLINQNRYPIKK